MTFQAPADTEREPGPQSDGLGDVLLIDLPTDRPRPLVPSGARGEAQLELAGAAAGAVEAPSLVAAFATLLHRYAGEEHIVLGWATDGGLAPLHLDLGDDPAFADVVARAEIALAAASSGGDEPCGQVALALDVELPAESAPELGLACRRHETGALLQLAYSADVYDEDTAARILGHVATILEATAADAGVGVGAVPLLTEAEREQLLVEWNRTAAPYPRACLHDLVAEQAARTPSAVAVEDGETQLTYAELDGRANRLANYLRDLGVGPEILVGICAQRSSELLVGILGILKAGGAYVPIDPTYPADRQSFMLTNSEAPVVLTEEPLLGSLPEGHGAQVVCLDRDSAAIAAKSDAPPEVESDPEQLAYVIYTSGSTGMPKGVQISHRALVNFLCTMAERPGLDEHDTLVAVTTLSFDIAGLELYLPLLVGARVVLAGSTTAADPRRLAELLERSDATVMQATPTTWRMLLDSGWPGRPGMKALCGGEALPLELADRLVACGLELWNMYGPTETTIWSTVAPIRTQDEPLTIGRPIANTTLYIVDPRGEPVPIGIPGELCIGGDGLARGYRGRDDLTEERFIADRFDARPGARIYRTGDLARYRRDGTVEFLGRIDHQVKVRGFRVELGEIETVLSRHPGVARAVAVARTDDAAGAQLVAYVVPAGVPVSSSALRRFVAQTLPEYMVPSVVVALESFPLTPNGKIDRKALPAPERGRSDEQPYVAARTPLETRLVGIWERVLEIEPIGVTDRFFDLGVTSIVAATLFAQIEHELGGRLPLGAIFQAPTIEALARLIEQGDESPRWTSLVPIQPNGSRTPIFCVHGGAGTILHLEPLATALGPEQPFYGLQARGLYGGARPLTTVEAMAEHYLTELRSVQPHGPYQLAGYCFGSIVAFDMAQRLIADGEEVRLLAMFNGPSPLWIRRWGWFGNQPSRRVPRPPKATRQEKLVRAVRRPWEIPAGIVRNVKKRRSKAIMTEVRLRLAVTGQVPESLREKYFLTLSAKAERAYEPTPFPGKILVFSADGLYEDPELGWSGLGERGVEAVVVPGDHDNNRQVMNEPYVEIVRDALVQHLT